MDLTKEDIKEAVREVMAEKIELTFGVNCLCEDERRALREDMVFLRAMRDTARRGGEKLFFIIVGLGGAALLSFLAPEVWKNIK